MHAQLREGLRQIRKHEQYRQTTIDLYFPSDYYRVDLGRGGLVHEDDLIVPFDISPIHGILDSSRLNYSNGAFWDHLEVLMGRYDLVFSLMEKYDVLPLLSLFERRREVTLILLAAPSWRVSIPDSSSNTYLVCTGADLVGKLDRASRHNL